MFNYRVDFGSGETVLVLLGVKSKTKTVHDPLDQQQDHYVISPFGLVLRSVQTLRILTGLKEEIIVGIYMSSNIFRTFYYYSKVDTDEMMSSNWNTFASVAVRRPFVCTAFFLVY